MAKRVFTNGKIYTVNENTPWASAVAIDGDRIVYVGDDEGAKAFMDGAEITDLDGKMMLPGFIDGHCHPIMAAYVLSEIVFDIDGTREDCIQCVKEYVEAHPNKETYFGMGYPEWVFDEKGPRKEWLDEICPDKPMFMMSSGGHEGWVNSKTLEICGIDKNTPDPIPGLHYYERDNEGNPMGHVVESKAQGPILSTINFFDPSRTSGIISENSADYAAMGVTATADMGFYSYMLQMYHDELASMKKNGNYYQRFIGCGALVDSPDCLKDRLDGVKWLHEDFHDDLFNVNFLKIINDGTMESRSAANSTPYPEDGSMIYPLLNEEQATEMGLATAEAGFDFNMHAIGNMAVKPLIAAAKAIREAGFADTRITCSHSQYIDDDDAPLFAKYDITANSTGVWFYGNPEMDHVLGEINNLTFRMKDIINSGGRVALGTDFPVDEYGREPLKSIEMCVTRKLYDQPDCPVLKPYDQKMTLEEAIQSYTLNNAYQIHMEDRLGSIEEGKYADLVILEKNLFDVPIEDVHKVGICETIMNGNTTFKA